MGPEDDEGFTLPLDYTTGHVYGRSALIVDIGDELQAGFAIDDLVDNHLPNTSRDHDESQALWNRVYRGNSYRLEVGHAVVCNQFVTVLAVVNQD